MAFVVFTNGKCKAIPADQALVLWNVMNNETPGTPAQQQFAKSVKHLWLNKETAPQSYVDKHITDRQVSLWYADR